METKIKSFDKQKSEQKASVISLWKQGTSISKISRDHGKSRATIYRWLNHVENKLAEPIRRKRLLVEPQTKNKIIELTILLKKPSIRILKERLELIFGIYLSEPQLRRYLKLWGILDYQPTASFDSLIREQAQDSIS